MHGKPSKPLPPPISREPKPLGKWPKTKPTRGCVWILTSLIILTAVLAGPAARFIYRRITEDSDGIPYGRIETVRLGTDLQHYTTESPDFQELQPYISTSGDTDLDSSSSHKLITMLLGAKPTDAPTLDHPQNNYLEGIRQARRNPDPGSTPRFTDGIYLDKTTGNWAVVNQWGNPFRIRLDTNKDAEIANPNTIQTAAGRLVIINTSALVWSSGKDGDWDTWEDNFTSWN